MIMGCPDSATCAECLLPGFARAGNTCMSAMFDVAIARHVATLVIAAILGLAANSVTAEISTYRVWHHSGACGDYTFGPDDRRPWNRLSRIHIASGERIHVRLYGHGADLANNASGNNIHEWIFGRGRTTDYPNPRIMGGQIVPMGYVTVAIEATPAHGTGNRTVTVHWPWPGQPETIPLKIVANCALLTGDGFRRAPGSASATHGGTILVPNQPPRAGSGDPSPNLLPLVETPVALARPLGAVIATPAGGMFPIHAQFCSGIPNSIPTSVAVPPLRWGALGTNIAQIAAGFEVRLFDDSNPDNPVPLANLALPTGFAPNTPQAVTQNYPGRPTSIRVISNPRFEFSRPLPLERCAADPTGFGCTSTTTNITQGCFTAPGVTQTLEPTAFKVVVDPANTVNEGPFENDNTMRF